MRNFINFCLLFSSGFLVFGWSPIPPISNSARSLAATSLESSGAPEEKSGNTQTVCIIGGGFGGLTCALSLSSLVKEKKDKPKIVLIDKRERFVFLPLLYELCVGDATIEEVAPTYSYLLEGTGVEFIQADVCDIDKQKQVVYSASGEEEICKYDSIILATGNEASFFGVPGAEKFAQAFYTIEDCYELRKKLSYFDARDSDFEKPLEVVVVGAGYSGVELALNIGERLCKSDDMHVNTYLVHRGNEILPSASDFNRQSSEAELVKKGVQLLTGTSVNEVQSTEAEERKKVLLSKNDGSIETIECDLLLWTTGNKPSDIIKRANFVTDKNGRIVTGKSLAVKGEKNVFAIGDCTRAALVAYPGNAQVAMQQAEIAAYNSLININKSHLGDKKFLAFRYTDLGEMMSLGSSEATINSLGGLVQLNGPAASIFRRLIYSVRMPTNRQRVTAAVSSSASRLSKKAGNKKQEEKN